jgi:predicted HTH transcriptional regulator
MALPPLRSLSCISKGKNVKNVPINVPVKDRRKKIIAVIAKDSYVSATKLAEKFGVTEKTIRRDLQLLKQQNLITRVGANKNGYWKVN